MTFPGVKLHQFYSLNLYDGLDIIFEDLTMLEYDVLKNITKELRDIHLIPNILSINTDDKYITIIGHNINSSTYMVNCEGKGDIFTLQYQCSNEDILTGIEYLHQIYKNMVIKSENKFDNKWNPKQYKPDE